MSLNITVNFDDSVNGSTTDTFALNDADATTFLSILATANATQGGPQRRNQQQQQVTPLTYDVLYHTIANNFWLGLQGRVSNIQLQSAQDAALATAQASVTALTPVLQTLTTPIVSLSAQQTL